MPIRREVGALEVVPFGYGIAWRRWDRHTSVCYPIPLNLVARLARRVWVSVKLPGGKVTKGWWERYEQGYRVGYQAAQRARVPTIEPRNDSTAVPRCKGCLNTSCPTEGCGVAREVRAVLGFLPSQAGRP